MRTSACYWTTRPCMTSAQDIEAYHANLRRPEPPCECRNEWCYDVPPIPRSVELRPPENCREPHPVPAVALLHGWFRSPHVPWIPAVSRSDGPGAHAADVRCQEHDVRSRPAPRPIPYRCCDVPRTDVHQGGGRTDAQRAEQELLVLRGMDPEQHQELSLRYPTEGAKDGSGLSRKFHGDPGDVQARRGVLHCHVQAQGLLALVHGRRDGRDGVHGGR